MHLQRFALSRRHLLRNFGAGAVAAFGLSFTAPLRANPIFASYPFQLGVASGEPSADGFVIWTRLAPDPLAIGHGMPAASVEIGWEVGADDRFAQIVQSGTAIARPELGHAVHVEVSGLQPSRPYWYRFTAGRERSAWGRAVTTPAAGQPLANLRFAVAGCQNYEQGYYTAYRDLARREPDFVFCYGDYIYEGRGDRVRNGPDGPVETVRRHFGDEIYSIDDYRRRYAQYKMDVDLQAAHAAAPWFVTLDDHEVDNNWVDNLDQDGTPPPVFALRRQMALQAYYEHMPLRASSLPAGPSMQLYRRAVFGDLLDFNLLDTRQYRSDQPCGDRWGVECADTRRAAEVLGVRQHDWLANNLRRSEATWSTLAQQVMVMDLDRDPGPGVTENLDSWAGYRQPRERLLQAIRDTGKRNTVVLTGDEHQNYAGELHLDGKNPDREAIATEFVATSISSGGDGEDQRSATKEIQAVNPQLKFHNSQRGYLLCDLTHERWQTEFITVDKVSVRSGTVSSRKKLVVEPGRAAITEA
ncbi:alkaline phosphatase [Erythrobacter sp. QSSC1-22B]|nr:alkaline phosphatase D family protein [Erythrobacter sp. QSSC1-22B]OBX17874.1 alkaline phosphatase [Erythrobacter sp. QSSC1-22B]